MPAVEPVFTPGRIELVFTLIMALAAVGTAWAGFQSSRWNNEQSDLYAHASALIVQSGHESNEAAELRTIDVTAFTAWIGAVNAEVLADPSLYPSEGWVASEGTASEFLYSRFRDEFRPAFDAWLAQRPLANPDAPDTPFVMEEYHLASQDRAEELAAEGAASADAAREAGLRAGNYVLVGVLLALAVFFAALGSKMEGPASRYTMLVLSGVVLVASVVITATYPVRM